MQSDFIFEFAGLAKTVPSAWISAEVLGVLAVILAASMVTFRLLERRLTSHRQRVLLSEWARGSGFRIQREPPELPPPLDLLSHRARLLWWLKGTKQSLVQIRAAPPAQASDTSGEHRRWNLLLREHSTAWPSTGLRPSATQHSILDFYSLSGFPFLGATERFIVFGTDAPAARAISQSMTRSLLPPDIGLLLHGRTMVLDFSDRPFDEIEFERLSVLADQLAEKLPSPPSSGDATASP